MTVSSVKNLNGETFSAVQDASLTDIVSSNSANWNEISAYQANSANYLQNTDLTIVDNKITEISGVPLSAGDELPASVSAATDYVTATSGDINATIINVSSNSGVWGGSALPISAGPGINLELSSDVLYIDVDTDYIVVTEETVGNYSVANSDVGISGSFSKTGYKPIAWTWKYGFAAVLNFNQEQTSITDNTLNFQGYMRNIVGSDSRNITFKLFITWVRV